jgi:hypothetical protein
MSEEYPEDKYWNVVLALAKKYGFILKADDSTAMLATHKIQMEKYGPMGYEKIQKMNGRLN